MTGGGVIAAHRSQQRHDAIADIGALGAAAVEAASPWIWIDWARRSAVEARPRLPPTSGIRNRADERGRVGMTRLGEQRLGWTDLHNLPEIHDRDARTEQSDDIQVVRHEEVAHPEPFAQFGKQFQNNSLDGNVECGGGFIEDEQRGLDGNRARDADARPLAAGKLMRVPLQKLNRQTDKLGCSPNARFDVRCVAKTKETAQRIRDGAKDAERRIEAVSWILEHDLDPGAIGAADKARLRNVGDVAAGECDRSAGRIDEASEQAHHGGLPATRLAHEANAFAGSDHKVHPIDGMELRAPRVPLYGIEFG